VVENIKKNNILIPLIVAILFTLIYAYLPFKYFIVMLFGVIGVFLVLYDIKLGLMAGVFLIPYLPDMLGLLFMYFLVCAFIFNELFRKKQNVIAHPLDTTVFLYLIVIVFSTLTSIYVRGSLRDLALHLGGISFLFVMVNNINNKKDFNKVVTFLIASATIVALYGLYQFVVGVEVDPAWVDVENSPNIRTRVYSVFYNPNILAEYLIMLIPISVGLFWYNKEIKKKVLYLGTTLIMTLALILTLSRGGWLGFAFSAFVFILIIERKLLLSIIPISVLGIYLLPQSIINRILSIGNMADSSNAYRLKMWEITRQIIKDNWKAGVGFGHLPFKQTFESYIRTMPTYHAHNTFLEVAAEIGIPGLIVFLFFLFIIFKYGILKIYNSQDRYIKVLGAGVISGLAGVLLHGLVENVLYIPRIIITFWMMISFILTLVRIEDSHIS